MKILTKHFNLIRIILLTLAISSTLTFFIGDVASTRPPSSGAGGVLATILVGDRPDGIAYNPSNQQVYVTSSGSVSVINNANKIIKTINVPFGAVALAYDSVNNDIYVASVYSNVVSVIDPSKNTVVASIAVNSPSNLVYDSSRKNVYVANFGTGSVSVISDSTNRIISRLVVGNNPFGVLYDPGNQRIYVANYSSRTVSVIDHSTNSVVSTVAAGNGPWNLAYDNANNDVYVTDFGSNTVSVIAG